MLTRPLAALATVLLLSALAGCSDSSSSDDSDAQATGPACTYTEDGRAPAKEVTLPPERATVSGSVEATISTSIGDINATLDADGTPCTVNSFVSLAEQGYFADTTCHRLTTEGIFVLQCGDPTATGSGGPGYSFEDELTGDENYGPGQLAMANAGPNTNGSQFFIVYGDSSVLDPNYTVFGEIDADSLELVAQVAAKGTSTGGSDGAPAEAVDITSVEVD